MSLKLKSEDSETNNWRKRMKRSHEMIKCEIELENGVIGRELTAQMVIEMVKYILYDRQQIPFPLSNSQSLLQLKQKSIEKQLTPKEEQILVTIEDLNQVFNELICLIGLDAIHVQCVSLSLGQTLQMPKELYCIQMPAQDIYSVDHSADCRHLNLRSLVTRFFKTILNDKNILFQNRKDIPITKIFVLIQINKCNVKQVLDHSLRCHQIDAHSERQLFTPHIDYEIPRIGNRFRLILRQKQCNCSHILDNSFEVFDETNGQRNDGKCLDKELSQSMAEVLKLNESRTEDKLSESNEEFVWIQIHSSIKGIQYNSNKSGFN